MKHQPFTQAGKMLSDSSTFATLVPVRNMDRALKFYRGARRKAAHAGGRGHEGLLGLGKVSKTEFWFVAPERREKRELAYTVFSVKNIREAVRDLKAKDVKFRRGEKMGRDAKVEGPISSDQYGATAFFKDSEGNLLMLWQNA